MKKRLVYVILFLLITAGILVPAYTHRIAGLNQASDQPVSGEAVSRTAPNQPPDGSTAKGEVTNAPSAVRNVNAKGALNPLDTGIAVVGMNGELLYGPGNVTVTQKLTALDILDATGLPYTLSGSFVEAIAGQRNKGQSGWMYMVNGNIPIALCCQSTLR